MPHRIEAASSGRARCRACRRGIDKGDQRFAEAVPNPVAEGESHHYYHLPCAAERRPQAFSELLGQLGPLQAELAALGEASALALRHHRLERLGALERAKSARATCRQCRETIAKETWRVALQPIEDGRLGAWGFVHLSCAGAYAGVRPSLARLVRYTELGPAELEAVAAALAAMPEPAAAPSGAPAGDGPAAQQSAPSEEGSADAGRDGTDDPGAGRSPVSR